MRQNTLLVAVLILPLVLAGRQCLAGNPLILHSNFSRGSVRLVHSLDQAFVEADPEVFRPFNDNVDRLHVEIIFYSDRRAAFVLAAPAAWGERRTADVAALLARSLHWRAVGVGIGIADGSLLAATGRLKAAGLDGRLLSATLDWPAFVRALRAE